MDDDEDIHDRLEQLEATVADQQQTIEQLTEPPAVGRRSVVASLLGAGAVGGLAGWGSQSARAASGPAGQQGTEEEPNDMFAWDLDVQGQVTSDLPMGGNDVTGVGALETERLESDWVVDVGKYASIQDGIEEAESTGKGLVIIPPGTYDETVEITDGSFDLYGFGRDSTQIDAEESEPLIKISGANNVSVFNLRLRNRGEGDALELNSARNHLKNAQVREGDVRINGTVQNCSVVGCDLVGNDVIIDGDNNVVVANIDLGTISDNGSGNEVGNNT